MEIELSAELRQELGFGTDEASDVALVTTGSKKRKLKDPSAAVAVAADVVEAAKKVSKKEQKKLDQIQLRKDKEEKREQYLSVLHAHEISDAHRQLLTSTKEIGQSLTLKGALKKALKRYKAGLAITEEEHELLFPGNRQEDNIEAAAADDDDNDADAVPEADADAARGRASTLPPQPAAPTQGEESSAVAPPAPPMPIDFSDIFDNTGGDDRGPGASSNSSSGGGGGDDDAHKKKKRRKKGPSSSATTVPAAPAAPAASVGSSLMQQLQRFKDKLKTGDVSRLSTVNEDVAHVPSLPAAAVPAATSGGEAAEEADDVRSRYVPVAIDEPVDAVGRIHVSTQPDGRDRAHSTSSNSGGGSSSSSSSSSSSRGGLVGATAVHVKRDPKIQAARLNLPVCGMEQEIVEAITGNDVVILCGETGSGKSTQVPQFLYEAGFGHRGLIGITQPRRVAATSTAERVADELGEPIQGKQRRRQRRQQQRTARKVSAHGDQMEEEEEDEVDEVDEEEGGQEGTGNDGEGGHLVGYQIRFDASTVGKRTRIKFMTDGILLREVTSDLLLRQYSVILLDEAHERNVNTDILLGMLSRALPVRRAQAMAEHAKWASLPAAERAQYSEPLQPLKLVIMSATIRVEDFCTPRLFPAPPPVIRVEARQYPVTVHFSRRTELTDYLKETYTKVCQIHRRLPDGGILVFLTGKREIMHMCRKVARALNRRKERPPPASAEDTLRRKATGAARAAAAAVPAAPWGEDGGGVAVAGVLRGLDEDEMEGDRDDVKAIGMGDGDGDGDDYSDEDGDGDGDGGSDDGSGYDSLDEAAILREEADRRRQEAQPEAADQGDRGNDDNDDGVHDDEHTGENAEAMRRRMLQQVLRRPATDEASAEAVASSSAVAANPPAVAAAEDGGGDGGDGLGIAPNSYSGVLVLPLFAMMTAEEQRRVFRAPPKGKRLVVIATNVAETSITIPGIRYVVDCGRQKERVFNLQSGVSKFEVRWVAQASAEQRAGRAGRTGPGHCYRLYSSAFFDQHMVRFQPPEILCTPLEDLLLNMRALGIQEVDNFPFPSQPPASSLKRALDMLVHLGAVSQPRTVQMLDTATAVAATSSSSSAALQAQAQRLLQRNKRVAGGKLTELGRLVARFPITPRFAKMLVVAHRSHVLAHTLALVSILAERSPFDAMRQGRQKKSKAKRGGGKAFAREKGGGASRDNGDDNEDADVEDKDDEEEEVEDEEDEEEDEEGIPAVEPASSLWYHPSGDSLSRLRAVGAFAFTAASVRRQMRAKLAERDEWRSRRVSEQRQAVVVNGRAAPSRQSKKQKHGAARDSGEAREAAADEASAADGAAEVAKAEAEAREEAAFAADMRALGDQVRRLCAAHGLHQTTLERALDLQGQLARICAQIFLDASSEAEQGERAAHFSAQLLEHGAAPPSKDQEVALRQVLLTGHGDCVARRAPLGTVKTGSRHRRLTAYLSSDPALSQEALYIHPNSVMYRSDPTSEDLPEWVIYAGSSSLVKNQRGDATYMTSVTPINPAWIPALLRDCPLLQWSAFLQSPSPFYDPADDCVMCYVIPKFGVHGWELPPVKRPLTDCVEGGDDGAVVDSAPIGFRKTDEAYRWFARCLLEGTVLPELAAGGAAAVWRCDKLKDAPSALTQMKPTARGSALLRALVARSVLTRAALLRAVKADPTYLVNELADFLPAECRKAWRTKWLVNHFET